MKSQASLGCVGSTDCAITRHCSLASSRAWLGSLGGRGHALVILLPVQFCRDGDDVRKAPKFDNKWVLGV